MKLRKSFKKNTPTYVLLIGLLFGFVLIIGFCLGVEYQKGFIFKKEQPLPTPSSNSGASNIVHPSAIPTTRPLLTTPTPLVNNANYTVPQSWTRISVLGGLMLCLPPKWEADQWGNIFFNRDPAYRPNVTYIKEISYKGGSRREAYYQFWEGEYPNVRQTVKVGEVAVNGNTILKFSGPESEKVVWLANGKLWQAGISGWEWVNDSKTSFLRNFYTMIGCSF